MHNARLSFGLAILSAFGFVLSLVIGPVVIPPDLALKALFGVGDERWVIILQEIRFPRAVLAFFIGGVLAMSGAALQGLTRNPLAEPGLIGVANGAAVGAVAALYFGWSTLFPTALPILAILGAVVAVTLLLMLTSGDHGVFTLILAGVALSSLGAALVALALNLAPNPFATVEMAFWLMGSLEDRSLDHLWLAVPPILLASVLLFYDRRSLDALSLGEDVAASMGISLRALRLRTVLGVACGVGAAVAVSGAIGFVGLIIPHIVRPFVGHRPGALHVPCFLAGAALLLLADTGVRLVPTHEPLKLGVVTAMIGVPFFLVLLVRLKRDYVT